jgi:ATP-dependent helicase/nuclease subunit B
MALRDFWTALRVEEKLDSWAAETPALTRGHIPATVHATVWEQINAWLANVELAFPSEALPLREWLPILDAGLTNLTVGVIPPALDQVAIGTLDRSRNPQTRIVFLLGWNETVFPATPPDSVLLSGADREHLEKLNVDLGHSARRHLSRERHYAYLACTRARERVMITFATENAQGTSLNPSPFLAHLKQLFPGTQIELTPRFCEWQESEHLHELIVPVLKVSREHPEILDQAPVNSVPQVARLMTQLHQFHVPDHDDRLTPERVRGLYGSILRSSVSRLEEYAACPFKFFVKSGLRAEERRVYEADIREQGSFQHDVLAAFHQELQTENRRWRDITPAEARNRVARIAGSLAGTYRGGLLQSTDQARFLARVLTASLQDFVETLVTWMRLQYQFDPAGVEVPFGRGKDIPAWVLDLSQGNRLELGGRIDRIDLCPQENGAALCVVIDYKSSHKKLESILIDNGLQLQLLSYLNVLRHWPDPRKLLNVERLIPAGVFYVNLRGTYEGKSNRKESLEATEADRRRAYRHQGRFDAAAIPRLDSRSETSGDQFNYRLKKTGQIYANCAEALPPGELDGLMNCVEENLRRMGEEVFAGRVGIDPYRRGQKTTCSDCDYAGICRVDPWTHPFRVLKSRKEKSA